jgi:hypothetical protein
MAIGLVVARGGAKISDDDFDNILTASFQPSVIRQIELKHP